MSSIGAVAAVSFTPARITIPPAGTDIARLAQQRQDQGVVATLSFDSASTGVYSSAGVLESLPGGLSDYWADVLKTNPALAYIVANASFTQGVLGTLDLYA